MSDYLKKEDGKVARFIILGIIAFMFIGLIIVGIMGFRLDFASGSHRIIPTAVDQDMWGNYKVYYRTTEYTKNSEEDYYYIEKGNTELAEQVKECIKNEQTILAYYDKYVGYKGFTAPAEAPITSIEIIEE